MSTPIRVVVTGPECTGKTTLARALATSLDAPWLPEASRAYAERAAAEGRSLTADDVSPIARAHVAQEDAAIAAGASLLVLDTDLLSTVAYARHYYGLSDEWISTAALERRGDLYLLCATDLAWEPDGVRDRPMHRDEMFALFERTLEQFHATVADVRGHGGARLDAALRAVRTLRAGTGA